MESGDKFTDVAGNLTVLAGKVAVLAGIVTCKIKAYFVSQFQVE